MNKIYIFLAALLVLSSYADDRVVVDLYYESLCPGCQNFIETELTPAIHVEGFETIANIRLFPYGNAKTSSTKQVTCQHGTNECYGNILEACAIAHIESAKSLEFITCVENAIEANNENFDKVSQLCYKNMNIPAADQANVQACQTGNEGKQLLLNAGQATDALNPAHKYVPWIVVNGQHTDDIQQQAQYDLVGYVCSLYTGPNQIAACKSYSRQFFKMFEFKLIDKCYKY
ncbi:gamma-interferon-inducible lysosomal thiol reductase (macronuclear) [Tetrahymena thermophila SB210]|uniref:Gamma-interferon-inducible lysosomal thiol reductase n=1 Tax=Tetrahymena thermophila (strain SB210) TaxID=312017 RepID=I7M747_TETTS|nr:gamma-interferon-inducible lysosomal thiol reductase [Tetrahymena thermophila SB210]EAR89365.1 gamma-interferon-inducible lysosomal thiol reductase [Tetrahymena thermophila SB210]|eukprot:XP_001009610.1 gamma-interferon-inducible lysosomal thiol reductase [Tetrahymena thermophila SB210]